MKAGTLKRVAVYAIVIAAAGVLGTVLGGAVGEYRAEAEQAAKGESLERYFQDNLTGIVLGEPFPDVVVWSAGRDLPAHLADVLPAGGMILYVTTSCDACVKTVNMVDRYRRAAANADRPVVVITRGDPESLAAYMRDRGIDIPVFQDTEDTFARVHRISAFPAVFILREDGVVRGMAAGPRAQAHIREFYTQ